MNKKLTALAVAGAFAAPVAMAQTANPVTLYGRVHLTLESVESKGNANNNISRRTRVVDQASLLGVRGTEDLGGGLKAFFQLETAFAPDEAPGTAGGFAGRNSGVGLQGGWGSIMMGRWDTPFKQSTGAVDPFGDVTIAGISSVNNDQGNFDRRDANMLQYWSPSWGGFNFKLMWQTSEKKAANGSTNNYDQGFSVAYARGPVYVFGTYEEHKDQVGSTATSGKDEKGTALGGTWAFGPVKIGGVYEEFKKTDKTKKKSYLANVVWTVSNHQFIFQYQEAKDGGANGAATQPDCKQNALAWQYNFSKRTFTQLIYSKTDNNNASNCAQGPYSAALVPVGSDPQGISLGLRHVF